MQDIKRMLLEALRSTQRSLPLDNMGFDQEQDEFQLTDLTKILAKSVAEKRSKSLSESLDGHIKAELLPRVITFPYSRHSSYAELCLLIKAFDPKDIYPCTVDESRWYEGIVRFQPLLAMR
jgi:DNA cross-link repair 1C protein